LEIGLVIIGILFFVGVIIGLSTRLAIIEEMFDSDINKSSDIQNFEERLLP
jgi:capsular polysaccharide biosynthesis protein